MANDLLTSNIDPDLIDLGDDDPDGSDRPTKRKKFKLNSAPATDTVETDNPQYQDWQAANPGKDEGAFVGPVPPRTVKTPAIPVGQIPHPAFPDQPGQQLGFVNPAFARDPQSTPPLPDAAQAQLPAPPPGQASPTLLRPGEKLADRPKPDQDSIERARRDDMYQQLRQMMQPVPPHKPTWKDLLLSGVAGFAAAGAQPNIAHGGGTDVMRGANAGFQTGLGIIQGAEDRAEARRRANADIAQKAMQAYNEGNRPLDAYYSQMARNAKLEEDIRNHNLQDAGRKSATDTRRELGEDSLGLRGAVGRQRNAIGAYSAAANALGRGLIPANPTAILNGTADAPKAQTDVSQLPIPAQDRHAQAQKMAQFYDARTNQIQQRASMEPDLLRLRQQMAAAAMMNAQSNSQRTQIAKNVFNWNYKGVDEDGNPVVETEDGRVVIPKIEAMQKVPAAMQTKVALENTVENTTQRLAEKVKQLESEGVIGPLSGRASAMGLKVGLDNPEVKGLQVALDNLVQLQVPLHGARGGQMAKMLQESQGGITQSPGNLLAALGEATNMARELRTQNQKVYQPNNRRIVNPAAGGVDLTQFAGNRGQGGQGSAGKFTVTVNGSPKSFSSAAAAQAYRDLVRQQMPNAKVQ